ncbi:MAG: proline dehydrogenase family protein [Bacteroidales bacterium]|jgi:proline dehydrogenase|nr:proline dehydrogenase family protein [Bacteroidales bacterium]MDG1902462.1 proline dehydrogenase family protein [Bacteroidales bacterium]MDG2081932.1 proline dehydrogenase family protein [Bacteroidales bacterium]|tara:strand:- start:8623 stop:9540 length:918 start_codon:yes stop_codon:yes gene_type:complete
MIFLNKIVATILPLMPQKLIWIFSKRYIAGQSLGAAIKIAKQLNSEGNITTIDLLGEFVSELDQAKKNKDEYIEIIEAVEKSNVVGNYSLKPTMFGLLIDKNACYKLIREVVAKAVEYDNFVRIDMEDFQCVDLEIELFRKIKKEFPKNVGLVFQAYLYRTMNDIDELMDLHSKENPLNYRLCKGIYVEPETVAFQNYQEINQNFLLALEEMFKKGIYPGIATHDEKLVIGAYELIKKYNVPNDKFEFQMLYGVTPALRKSIIKKGYKMRIYTPFGKQWFAYSTRRLKENPKMAQEIIKALIVRG